MTLKYNIVTTIVLLFSIQAITAQTVWKGGSPGRENSWNTDSNWSTGRVPTEFDDVIIPDVSCTGNFYPVIDHTLRPVQHLCVESNACVFVEEGGVLVIDGITTFNHGILNYGTILNKGRFIVRNTALQAIANENNGNIIDHSGKEHNCQYADSCATRGL